MNTEKIMDYQRILNKHIEDGFNIDYWIFLQKYNECFFGCKKFEESLFIKKKGVENAKILNPKYLTHIKETHGFPPIMLVQELAKQIYKDEKMQEKMVENYNFLERY